MSLCKFHYSATFAVSSLYYSTFSYFVVLPHPLVTPDPYQLSLARAAAATS